MFYHAPVYICFVRVCLQAARSEKAPREPLAFRLFDLIDSFFVFEIPQSPLNR